MAEPKNIFRTILKFFVFLGTGVGILWLLYRKQNAAYQQECLTKGVPAADCSLLDKILTDFGTVQIGWIVLVLIAFSISNISRALRWQMLLRSLGYRTLLGNAYFSVILGYFANLGLPRVGEFARAAAMARNEHIPVEKVMGTVVLDRIADVVCILIVSALAFVMAFDKLWGFIQQNANVSEKASSLQRVLLLVLVLGILGVGFLWFFRKKIMETAFFQRIRSLAVGFWEGIQSIRKIDKPGLFVFHTINIWAMYFLMTWFCFFAFPPTAGLSAIAAFVVFVLGGWGIVIPSPGGMGTYHFLAQTGLMMYGVSSNDGFSWANISFFSIQLGANVLMGILAVIILPFLRRPAPSAQGEAERK